MQNGAAFEEDFRSNFDKLSPRIVRQWSTVDPALLAAAKGDWKTVLELVVAATDRAPAEIEAKLRALLTSDEEEPGSLADRFGKASKQMDEVIATVKRFEAFAAEEAKRMKGNVLPAAETKIRANLWTSLLIALGLGFVLGLWLRGGQRR
jgi:uncharacterized protein YecA (UPF0149 family)